MTTEALKGFPKTIQTALRDGKIDYAIRLFNYDKHSDDVKNTSWDLISVITEHLTDENRCSNLELYKCCQHLLNLISLNSNAEEALLQFISEIEEAKEVSTFVTLLDPLYNVVCRIPSKKVNSLAWSFNAIQTYICQCALPEYDNLEGKERLLVDNSEIVLNIVILYKEVVGFYEKFLNYFLHNENIDRESKFVLQKFLAQLLGSPLCYLNMELFDDLKMEGRVVAENLVHKLFRIFCDPFVLIEMRNKKLQDELVRPDDLSIAHTFYLVFCEGICLESVPKVYSATYIFESSLNLFCSLTKTDNNILTEKALKLAQYMFVQIKCNQVSYLHLDCDDHSEFCRVLCNVIMYNQSESLRRMGLSILSTYLNAFEIKGIYLIISNLMDILTHSGLQGYLITFYKDLISREFQKNELTISDYCKGPKLCGLLRKFCHLSDKEETNLMNNSDRIISSLNLIRYLALRDKNNVTRFWDFSATLTNIYFEPLRKGIELSRAHYELEIKNKNEENVQQESKSVISVSVGDENLALMKKNENLKVLKSSLTAFDVMQSLLSRVTELLERN